MAIVWSATASLSLGAIVAPTSATNGLFFKVTTAGTTGSSEPNWPSVIGETAYDNDVRYVSFSSTFENLQSINPGSVIELFTIELIPQLHYKSWEANKQYKLGDLVSSSNTSITLIFKCTTAGFSGGSEPDGFASASIGDTLNDFQIVWTAQNIDIYRFHSGANLNANGEMVWDGNSYLRFPIECTGFEFGSTGTLPRPKISISNIFGTITAIMQDVNEATVGNDLNGAKFTRIRTLARYLDAANFTGGTNPFGTPDPTAEFPQEIYFLDRKVTETRDIVTWEAQSALDLVNVKLPQRIATQDIFPGIGAFLGF